MGALKLKKTGYYVPETDTTVYINRIVEEFESLIEELDTWSNEKQLVQFGQQGLLFEARVIKSESEVCICNLYANTERLDVLEDLEELLCDILSQHYSEDNQAARQSIRQAKEIKKDQAFVKIS